ncbi:splicing factor PTSR1 interacting protein [Leptomonas seymouri]|uniref:Splicing factor PTSR1 interacting protein n=1 Tax=Leptomonas seymouri TaxID=5684 RepID=A0A0N1HR54_LEPSE|nr:splicing factor PTSR1 interacting protein [Leptomonas seymouri]|eukprot:KPI82638.1 splicing factor PTSR1 interacting protein [Leptomonas seymouri]
MDVIPPEYDAATKERVYRQEWLEYFNYIGYEAAMRDFSAQYHALFPNGHQRQLVRPAQAPLIGLAGEPLQLQPQKKVEDGRAASEASLRSSAGSSAPSNTWDGPRRPAEADRRDRSRHPHSSRRDGLYSTTRDRDNRVDEDERRRRRHRHRSHPRSSRDDGHYISSSSSRRRRRSAERDDRRGWHSSSHDDDSRRHRREGESVPSRSRAYDDRREDALRRRPLNHRR